MLRFESNRTYRGLQQALTFSILVLFIGAGPALAADPPQISSGMSEEESDHGGGHHYHVAAFFGATTNIDGEHTDLTLGIDAEKKLGLMHGKLGVGIIAEAIFAEHTELILGVPLFYHATDKIKLVAAIARTFADDGHGGTHQATLIRLGAGYDLHLGGITLTPAINTDFIEGHLSVVYGLAAGIGF